MKLFNFESFKKPKQEKPLTDQEIEKENIPIHEESGPIIKDREGLSLDQQDQTLIKEHLDLNDDGFEKTPSKENKFIPIENISDDDNKENNILDNIDIENINLEKIRKDIDGIENIKNVEIKNIIRKGKLLIFELSSGKYLTIHLKMSGQLVWPGNAQKSRVSFKFSNGKLLDFNDNRLFGELKIVDDFKNSLALTNDNAEKLVKHLKKDWVKLTKSLS